MLMLYCRTVDGVISWESSAAATKILSLIWPLTYRAFPLPHRNLLSPPLNWTQVWKPQRKAGHSLAVGLTSPILANKSFSTISNLVILWLEVQIFTGYVTHQFYSKKQNNEPNITFRTTGGRNDHWIRMSTYVDFSTLHSREIFSK
jgi:hypothetical protein